MDKALLAVTGIISVAFGVLMFVKPVDGALVLLALIAAYSLIVGIAELTVAIGGKRLLARATCDYLGAAGPRHPTEAVPCATDNLPGRTPFP